MKHSNKLNQHIQILMQRNKTKMQQNAHHKEASDYYSLQKRKIHNNS